MRQSVLKYICQYIAFVVIYVLQKPLFMLYNGDVYADASFGDYLSAMWHGLPHDLSLAGYLSVIPSLLIIARQWTNCRWLRTVEIAYAAVVAIVMTVIFAIDAILYGFWGTKLDTTPIFYVFSSPTAAAASVSVWFVAAAVAVALALSTLCFIPLRKIALGFEIKPAATLPARIKRSAAMLLLTGLLFIPIRGGFTVATMNISAVYHSPDIRMNHAAVNPAFSFMYAATHESDFDGQFNYFDTNEAHERFSRLMAAEGDSVTPILNKRRPDIYLIILESFSAHLMPSLGGEDIARNLESIAADGLLFTNCYASSFRTDRAIPAILSAYPGQPSTSIMKYAPKAETLPSIGAALKAEGYDLAYYYGGDANYTNMKAFLMSGGFEKIISDKDFPIGDRLSKWGVVDHKVFERCYADLSATTYDSAHPRFTVIQTSSSHEPFDVPYHNQRFELGSAANAFAYADSCVGAFVSKLKASPDWDNTLLIFIPDHYGAHPRNLVDDQRFHIPMIFAGGALSHRGRFDLPTAQTDLVATLLGQLGINHSDFTFSKNVFDPTTKHFAAFSNASTLGWITPSDTLIYSLADNRLLRPDSTAEPEELSNAKAFLQTLYDDLSRR